MDEVETWRDIPETDYSVSSLGRMASRKYGRWSPLKPGVERGGYRKVELCHSSIYSTRKVHHLKEIKARLAAGQFGTWLAVEYGVKPQSIYSIKRGATWAWLV
jgi:hypothetical protein